MYDDYFYKEEPKKFNVFPNSKKIYEQRKAQNYKNSKRGKKKGKKPFFKILTPSQANMIKKAFSNLENDLNKTSSNCQGIVKSMNTLAKMAMLAGVALFGINKFLDIKSMTSASDVYGGSAAYGVSGSGRSSGKLSAKGKQFIANEEGLRTEAYKDSRGVWTIGVGHTGQVDGKPVGPGMKISKEKAMQLFEQDIAKFENYVNKVVKVPVSQNMFDAMVSYSYNVGSLGPKFLQKLNSGDYKGAMHELTTINTELQNRRKREQELFGLDISSTNTLKIEVAEVNPYQEMPSGGGTGSGSSTNISSSIGQITHTQSFGNGAHYGDMSNITSHTKLTSGTNRYYDASKGEMGTFMGKTITSGIGRRTSKGSSFHRGLDLSYAYGTPVYSFTDGTVTFASVMGAFGRLVIVTDSNRYQHLYGHLSKISVSKNKKVKKGDLLGYSGGSSKQNGKLEDRYFAPHLHYGIWKPDGKNDRSAYIDPRTYTYPEDLPASQEEILNAKKLEAQRKALKEQEKQQKEQEKKKQTAATKNKSNTPSVSVNTSKPNQTNVKYKDTSGANPAKLTYDKDVTRAKKGK